MSNQCPLCHSHNLTLSLEIQDKSWGARTYWRCSDCVLTFMEPSQHLNREQEKGRYDLHENDVQDQDYIQFLKQLAIPLSQHLKQNDCGLDFGCGPTPAMSFIFKELGYDVVSYDPHFKREHDLLKQEYDFIVCSETAEHFYNPRKEFELLDRLLKSGGYLGVMTTFLESDTDFSSWYYRHDPTHVCFYRKETFEWIAHFLDWKVDFPVRNVVVFQTKNLCN